MRGVGFLLKSQEGGGLPGDSEREGGGEGPGGCLRGIGGGGVYLLFRDRNSHQGKAGT